MRRSRAATSRSRGSCCGSPEEPRPSPAFRGILPLMASSSPSLLIGLALVLALRGPLSQAIPFFTIQGAMVAGQAVLFFATGWLASLVPALRSARVPPSAASSPFSTSKK